MINCMCKSDIMSKDKELMIVCEPVCVCSNLV